MLHLLTFPTFQSINNVLYFFNLGGIEIFLYPTPYTKKILGGGGKKIM